MHGPSSGGAPSPVHYGRAVGDWQVGARFSVRGDLHLHHAGGDAPAQAAVWRFRGTQPLPRFLEALAADLDAWSRLQHGNLCRLLDVGRIQGELTCYWVQETTGPNLLSTRLEADEVFDPSRALHITLQLAHALVEVHRGGLVHGDLDPMNVGLVGSNDQVRLCWGGLANRLEAAGMDTGRGSIRSSAEVAPEAITGVLSPAADIYGLAALLFRLLVGRPPFPGDDTPPGLEARDRLVDLPGYIPADLVSLMGNSLRRNPAGRPPLTEFLNVLVDVERRLTGLGSLDSAPDSLGSQPAVFDQPPPHAPAPVEASYPSAGAPEAPPILGEQAMPPVVEAQPHELLPPRAAEPPPPHAPPVGHPPESFPAAAPHDPAHHAHEHGLAPTPSQDGAISYGSAPAPYSAPQPAPTTRAPAPVVPPARTDYLPSPDEALASMQGVQPHIIGATPMMTAPPPPPTFTPSRAPAPPRAYDPALSNHPYSSSTSAIHTLDPTQAPVVAYDMPHAPPRRSSALSRAVVGAATALLVLAIVAAGAAVFDRQADGGSLNLGTLIGAASQQPVEAEPLPEPPPPAPVAQPVAARPAMVTLISDPPAATVLEDGEPVGVTPLRLPLTEEAGSRSFVLELEGYDSREIQQPYEDGSPVHHVHLSKAKPRRRGPRRRRATSAPAPAAPAADTVAPAAQTQADEVGPSEPPRGLRTTRSPGQAESGE